MFTPLSPYVYLGIHKTTNQFYIGVRYSKSSNRGPSPEEDLGSKYFTTSKIVKPIFWEFNWTIIAQFLTKEDALEFEECLINDHWKNPLMLNQNKGGKKFHRPDVYIKKPKKDTIVNRSVTMKQKWSNHEYKLQQIQSRLKTHTTKEFRDSHSITMKKVSQESKNIRRVCRLHDKKEMTVQNFFRYLTL